MKYEIIGWTSCTDRELKHNPRVSEHVEDVIQREVIEKGYMFGGDAHEDYCPVLNDGTLVSYSWRGWEGMMARAFDKYGHSDGYFYRNCYINDMIPADKRKYPRLGYEESKIVPAITLAEKHVLHVDDNAFDAFRSMKKRVECRPYDTQTMMIDKGDYIQFESGKGAWLARVADRFVVDAKEGFKQIFRLFDSPSSPYPAESLGEHSDADAFDNAMRALYPDASNGAIAFVVEEAAPIFYAEYNLFTNQWSEFYADEWGLSQEEQDKLEPKDYFELSDDNDALQEELDNYGDFDDMVSRFVRSAEGKDLNKLLTDLLGIFFGKEKEVLELQKKHLVTSGICLTAFYPNPKSKVAKPQTRLSDLTADFALDPKIKEFCEKTNCWVRLQSHTFL